MAFFRNFDEFHATVTKQMPDAVKYPEMYDLCYRLMKLTWDAAKTEEEGWEDRSAIQGSDPGLAELIKERQEGIARESARLEALTHEEKEKQLGAIRIEQEV